MIINSLYGTGNINLQDNVAVKESETVKSDAGKSVGVSLYSDDLQTISDMSYNTYEDALSAKSNANEKQGLTAWENTANEENLDYILSQMSEDDYQDMSKEGMSLEKYNEERLDRALQRIKEQRAKKEEGVKDQKESLDESEENVEKMSYSDEEYKIAKKLEEANLPVTDENIAKLTNVMELASTSLQISDEAKSYMIKNDVEPTIENIYKAQYSATSVQTNKLSDETIESLKGQISDIIEKSGLELNEENTESAKWLLNRNLPLTQDNLWALRDIDLIQENYDKDQVLDAAAKAMAEGKSPESASLSCIGEEQAASAVAAFSSITDEAVEYFVSQNQDEDLLQANCKDLVKVQRQLNEESENGQAKEGENAYQTEEEDSLVASQTANTTDLDIKTITIRRQLEEIRLKMTYESAGQLIDKGFQLDTDSLSKIVDGLKDLENSYYQNLLKEGNTAVTEENVDTLKSSLLGVEELKTVPSYILGSTLASKNIETVSSLLSTGSQMKANFEKAGETYEALMTKPRADMGDSIKKAFQNVDTILEDMDMETTTANQRAVRILGYNGMEITQDNILQVKSYDEQVNRLMQNFHPAVAVELIKTGENPLNMSIDSLNQQIDDIKSELGVTQEEQYGKYLWKLEKNNELSEEEKNSYIGIYRLLNQVEKTDGAAVGAVVKAEQEVTMKNLLTAVRTIKSGGIDTQVDDSFGALSQLTFQRESITDQLNSAFSSDDSSQTEYDSEDTTKEETISYVNNLLKDIMQEISPEKLSELGDTESILSLSVEKFHEEITSSDTDTDSEEDYQASKLSQLRELAKGSEEAIKYLNSYDIPTSIENIQAAKDVLDKDYSVFKQLKNLLIGKTDDSQENTTEDTVNTGESVGEEKTTPTSSFELSSITDKLINALTGQESMEEEYETLGEDVNKVLDTYYGDQTITSKDVGTLQRINFGMSFIQQLAGKESYEIPLYVGDSVTNVNVTILRNTDEKGKVTMDYDSSAFGKVSIDASVKGESTSLLITCDNRAGKEMLESGSEALEEAISGIGLNVKQLNYGIGNKISGADRYISNGSTKESSEEDQSEVLTNTLYSLARTVLIQVKEMELSNQ